MSIDNYHCMENYSKSTGDVKDILCSRTVKAGKRIYYLDVKAGRNHDLYLSVTESKKRVEGDFENPSISYEKHKIFVYQEDLPNFLSALDDVLEYINQNGGAMAAHPKRASEAVGFDPEPGFVADEDDAFSTDENSFGETF